ncbi:ATP-binding cassette domain-containing protein [Aeromicrobium sp. UC242_57]|uniref:ATP-binding cassette domain-containing protein n=1 Tax=Aeromicrobium sp. UC242_57 TaxID=3374624 RepID=UPI00379E562D
MARSWGYLAGLTTGLSGLLLAAVALVAGTRALDGGITVGQLIALVGLTQFLAEPIAGLGEISAQFAASRASAARIVTFLHTPRLLTDGDRTPTETRPQIAFEQVLAGPLGPLSFETVDGELLALVIDDPAVSDTVVNLLSGNRTADHGQVLLGDVRLDDISIAARQTFVLVNAHHTELFAGTLRNIVDPDATLGDDDLAAVLAASAADDVVALHPEGLERAVRPGGLSLSGGQRQRLALARALAAHKPVLVLQDPTSAVDSVTEQAIADGLHTARKPVGATILITSSPALLQRADRVLFIQSGRLVSSGTHADLMTDPVYRGAVLR